MLVNEQKILGEGGYGYVYSGSISGLAVAVKKLKGESSDTVREQFKAEVKTWDGIKHENVLPLLYYCLAPPMLVMPLVEEGDLIRYLRARNYDPGKAMKLVLDVAVGMTHLHSVDVIHGDLKCKNVLVLHGVAKICDFGLSRVRADISESMGLSVSANVRGTYTHMPPERLVDHARPRKPGDVYAFAMLAYECLSGGEKPWPEFRMTHVVALLKKVDAGERPERPGLVGDEMWELIQRCWAQGPGERPRFGEVVERMRKCQRVEVPLRRTSSLRSGAVEETRGAVAQLSVVDEPARSSVRSGSALTQPSDSPVNLLPGHRHRVLRAFSAALSGQMSVLNSDVVEIVEVLEDGWVLAKKVTPKRREDVGRVAVAVLGTMVE